MGNRKLEALTRALAAAKGLAESDARKEAEIALYGVSKEALDIWDKKTAIAMIRDACNFHKDKTIQWPLEAGWWKKYGVPMDDAYKRQDMLAVRAACKAYIAALRSYVDAPPEVRELVADSRPNVLRSM